MSKGIPKLRQRAQAVEWIAAGHSQEETAAKVGVSTKSVYRWNKDPEFKLEVDRRIGELVTEKSARLRRLIDHAINVYAQALQGKDGKGNPFRISVAQRNCAYDVLKSFGILRDSPDLTQITEEVIVELGVAPSPVAPIPAGATI